MFNTRKSRKKAFEIRGEGIWAWLVPPFAVEKRDPSFLPVMVG